MGAAQCSTPQVAAETAKLIASGLALTLNALAKRIRALAIEPETPETLRHHRVPGKADPTQQSGKFVSGRRGRGLAGLGRAWRGLASRENESEYPAQIGPAFFRRSLARRPRRRVRRPAALAANDPLQSGSRKARLLTINSRPARYERISDVPPASVALPEASTPSISLGRRGQQNRLASFRR